MSAAELSQLEMLNMEAAGNGKRWGYNTAYKGLHLYNDKIRQVAEKQKIELIDLEKILPKSTRYFYDDVHYKSPAYDIITAEISRDLENTFFNKMK